MTSRPLDVAFVVQGEGRGHMTQALAVKDFLTEAGHRVTDVFLGVSPHHPAPDYFQARMGVPVTVFTAPTLVPDGRARAMSLARTTLYNVPRIPTYVGEGLAVRRRIRSSRPDVVVNFYDLIAGFVHLISWSPKPPPRVAVGHVYLLDHPGIASPPQGAAARWGLRLLSGICGAGAGAPLGLSFDELPDAPAVRVVPPLLRRGLESVETSDGGYLLAYALNAGYVHEVSEWQARNPEVPVHCYSAVAGELGLPDRPGFTLHALDDEAFIRHMADCRAYVGTAGFEAVCEAFYLGKPVLAAPVEGHPEQAFNAADLRRAGLARVGTFADLSDFWRDLPTPAATDVKAFRRWVCKAPEIVVSAVEHAARGTGDGA